MQLIDRAFRAMEILGGSDRALSVSELSEALSIPPSSTHRVLASLVDNGYVVQDEETKRYQLSYKLYTLCSSMKTRNLLVVQARPYMKRLSAEIGQTVVLCVRSGDFIMNLDCVENRNASVYLVRTGVEQPMYATSAGRVFAAWLAQEEAKRIFSQSIRSRKTPYTKTDMEELLTELKTVRKQGYALIDEELQTGIQGVSCPVRDWNGNIAAALAVTTVKAENALDEKLIERLKEYAGLLSAEISGTHGSMEANPVCPTSSYQ